MMWLKENWGYKYLKFLLYEIYFGLSCENTIIDKKISLAFTF